MHVSLGPVTIRTFGPTHHSQVEEAWGLLMWWPGAALESFCPRSQTALPPLFLLLSGHRAAASGVLFLCRARLLTRHGLVAPLLWPLSLPSSPWMGPRPVTCL